MNSPSYWDQNNNLSNHRAGCTNHRASKHLATEPLQLRLLMQKEVIISNNAVSQPSVTSTYQLTHGNIKAIPRRGNNGENKETEWWWMRSHANQSQRVFPCLTGKERVRPGNPT